MSLSSAWSTLTLSSYHACNGPNGVYGITFGWTYWRGPYMYVCVLPKESNERTKVKRGHNRNAVSLIAWGSAYVRVPCVAVKLGILMVIPFYHRDEFESPAKIQVCTYLL